LLILAPQLLPSALDVLDILDHLGVLLSFFSKLFPVALLGSELRLLIFIEPGYALNVDGVLLEGGEALA
jgi:hypothetical protein